MRRVIPFLVAALAALIGASATWRLVERDLRMWESGAFIAGPEFLLVILAAVVLGVAAFLLTWQRLVGPSLEHGSWSLVVPADALPAGAPPPTVGDLRARLEPLGYALAAALVDDDEGRPRPTGDDTRLAGAPLQLRQRDVAARAGRVVLRVPAPGAGGEIALGFVDSYGALDGSYEELAQYAIAALGGLYPGLRYKRMDSGLSEELASELWAELPERPIRLSTPTR